MPWNPRVVCTRIRERLVGLGAIQDQRRSQYAELPIRPGDIVLLGDSLTEGGCWSEWFPGLPVRNRGISGDTVAGAAVRLEQLVDHPAQVVLLIGTNDVTAGVRDAQILDGVESIVRGIRERSPATAVAVQGLAPRTPALTARLRRLNVGYRAIAGRHGAIYLDLWPALATGAGTLRPEFTNDGLHLLGPGYRAWADVLRPVLGSPTA